MRVLLINPRLPNSRMLWIPLGLACIAAYLRKNGIEVKIADNNLEKFNIRSLSRLLREYAPDIVGTGGMTVQCTDAMEIGRLVKSIDKNVRLVYGGVHFTFKPDDGLRYGDLCVIGEGEQIFLELCKEGDLFGTERGTIGPGPLVEDLDMIPYPAYDLLEMDRYNDSSITGEKAMGIMTGRGCPYNCVFCASPQLYGRRVRYHSLDYVISHVKYLTENYGIKNLEIVDDTFTLSKKRVLDFCDRIEENGFELNMSCLTHVRNADYELFRRMKEVGFSLVSFGIESGNDRILQMINKGSTCDDARKAIMLAKEAGLDTGCLFMVGNIGENESTIFDSINFAREINPPNSNSERYVAYNWFQFATPFPGSRFYEIADQYGRVLSRDWSEYVPHERPVFVPKELDSDTMIKLRHLAQLECGRFGFEPASIKGFLVARILDHLMNIVGHRQRILLRAFLKKILRD